MNNFLPQIPSGVKVNAIRYWENQFHKNAKPFAWIIFLLGFLPFMASAQTYTLIATQSGTTKTGCTGTFLDGGSGGNYLDNSNYTMSFCANNGGRMKLTFNSFDLEDNLDFLYIYDGPTTASPLLGTYSVASPGTIFAKGSCLTVKFVSNATITAPGWSASIACVPLCYITNAVITPTSACNNNGTASFAGDDYYTANVTLSYTNIPTPAGALILTGDVIGNYVHSSALGSTTSYTFSNVKIAADGSVPQIKAYFASVPTCIYTTTAPSMAACSSPCGAGVLGGVVFRDMDEDGEFEYGETAQSGINVTVFNAAGTNLGTTTSDANGNWFFNYGSNAAPFRVEFSIPTSLNYMQPARRGNDNKSDVQFASGANCNLNFGVNIPSDYCQTNPKLNTNRYVEGNNVGSTETAIISVDYQTPTTNGTEATAGTIGTTYGLAYQRASNTLFASAYQKRFTGYANGNPGCIYRINNPTDNSNAGALFVDLNTLFGTPVFGTDPHDFTTTGITGDILDGNSFNAVGRISFGDIDISEDELYLWAVNLNNRSLYRIPLSSTSNPVAPTSSAQVLVVPMIGALTGLPAGVTNNELRPFGLKVKNGLVYIGVVTNGEAGGSLNGLVYAYNPTANTFTKVLEFPLNYNRGCGFADASNCYGSANWRPWTTTNTMPTPSMFAGYSEPEAGYPQPVFADIEFDANNNMLIGLRDRWGDQGGMAVPTPNNAQVINGSG
ncbi:MAG: SdrD B-like domain-containing protein, partial [Bacteroidia bacterium]